MGVLSRGLFFRGAGQRSFRGLEALVIATLYVACTDPPNLGDDGSAGSAGKTGGSAGAGAKGGSSTGGTTGGSAGTTGGSGGENGGKAGAGAKGGSGGKGGSSTGGTGGGTSGTDQGGEAGMSAGMAGEGGATGGNAGEGGVGAVSGQGGAGEAGAGPIDACTKAAKSVGGKSIMYPPATTGVAQPSGTPGNLKVINWAGFKGAMSWTFDDNLSSMVTHYPDLAAVGVPLTFYLVCSTEGSNAVWHTAHAAGHELGNHTMNHCNINGSNCGFGSPPAGAFDPAQQLDQCTAQLKSEYGLDDVYSMAAPNGDTGWDAYAATRFLLNRGVSDSSGLLPNSGSDPFNLPCHISNGPDTGTPNSTNSQLAAGAGGFNEITDSMATSGVWKTILIHSFGGDNGYHEVQISEAVAALTYAKSKRDSGDVWVDTVSAIGAYWRAQKAVSSVTPVTSGGDITYSWTLPDHFPPNMYLRVTVDGGTVKQCGTELTWDDHGYYEIALDAGSVTISP